MIVTLDKKKVIVPRWNIVIVTLDKIFCFRKEVQVITSCNCRYQNMIILKQQVLATVTQTWMLFVCWSWHWSGLNGVAKWPAKAATRPKYSFSDNIFIKHTLWLGHCKIMQIWMFSPLRPRSPAHQLLQDAFPLISRLGADHQRYNSYVICIIMLRPSWM